MTAAAVSLACPECDAPMALKQGQFGPYYGCTRWPACKGSHGAHPDGSPVGIPANRATKDARIRAHQHFDLLWEGKGRPRRARDAAYAWLRMVMGLTSEECHFGSFTAAQCEKAIRLLRRRLSREGIPLPEDVP